MESLPRGCKNVKIVTVKGDLIGLKKEIGKDLSLLSYPTREVDDYQGLSIDLKKGKESTTLLSVECDVVQRQIMINILGENESLKEYRIDF